MFDCTLVDCMYAVDSEDEFPVIHLESASQLREELLRLKMRRPSIIHLANAGGDVLILGVGSVFGAIRWVKVDNKQFLCIGRPTAISAESGLDFQEQGSDTGVRAKFLLPIDNVVEAAVYFFSTGKLPDWMHLSVWNEESNRLEDTTPHTSD